VCKRLVPAHRIWPAAQGEPLHSQFEQLRGAWEMLDADARASLAAKLDEVALAWMQYAESMADSSQAPASKHDAGGWR
jgi:hypothetical protein